MKTKISISIDAALNKNLNSLIDGLNIRNKSQAIEYLIKKSMDVKKTAVILCGGESLKTETGVYRICAPFLKTTVIEYNLKILRKNGFAKIHVAGNKQVLIEVFKIIGNGELYGVSVEYLEDDIVPKGSMNTLSHVKNITQTFLVASGDIILGETNVLSVWNAHILNKCVATLHIQATINDVEKRGVVTLEGNLIKAYVEKPINKRSLINYSGFFVAEPEFFNQIGLSFEFDIFPRLAKNGLLCGHPTSEEIHHFHSQKELNKIEKILNK